MKYIILQLILNSLTGEPLAVAPYNETSYTSLWECETAKAAIGPQQAVDGKVKVFACAKDEVTFL